MEDSKAFERIRMNPDVEGLGAREFLAAILDSSEEAIIGKTLDGTIVSWNPAAEKIYGYSAQEVVGRPISILVPADRSKDVPNTLERIKLGERVEQFETVRVKKGGDRIHVSLNVSPVRNAAGNIVAAATTSRDITEQKRLWDALSQHGKEALEISTPVLQVWERVVMAPFIGTLDTDRAEQFMERLLNFIVETNSSVALLDVTGMPAIDTRTAQHLIETIASLRLLGAQAILTGVRPSIARTLAHLGIDLRDVITRSSLAGGIRVALDLLNLTITERTARV